MKKRYWIFAGADYYPGGGLCDMRGWFDTPEEALREAGSLEADWFQVLDTETGEATHYRGDGRSEAFALPSPN